MKNPLSHKSRFEFLNEFKLLINHIDPHKVIAPSGYILNLISLLDEAERLKATKLLVLAPAEVYDLDFKMHDWVSRYLIPQMNHLGIKRVAFCVSRFPEKINEHSTIFGHSPEVGVFTSMPRAKAWVLGVTDKPESILLNNSRFTFNKKSIAS